MNTAISNRVMTTQEVALRFNELAQQEQWFEIQDELFAENVTSTDPPGSPYFNYAEGKAAVRKKARRRSRAQPPPPQPSRRQAGRSSHGG